MVQTKYSVSIFLLYLMICEVLLGYQWLFRKKDKNFTSFPLCVKKTLAMFWAAGFSWSALGFGNLIPHPILSPTWDLGPNGLPKPFAL